MDYVAFLGGGALLAYYLKYGISKSDYVPDPSKVDVKLDPVLPLITQNNSKINQTIITPVASTPVVPTTNNPTIVTPPPIRTIWDVIDYIKTHPAPPTNVPIVVKKTQQVPMHPDYMDAWRRIAEIRARNLNKRSKEYEEAWKLVKNDPNREENERRFLHSIRINVQTVEE